MIWYTVLTTIYRVILVYFVVVLVWNIFESKDWRRQLLGAIIIIPFVLRALHIK